MSKKSRNKLNHFISMLSTIELKHISYYINSDLHGFPAEVSIIYEELHKCCLKKLPLPDNEEILTFMKPHGKYTLQDIRLYKTYILKCIEKVLIQKELEARDGQEDVLLFSAYNKKELSDDTERLYIGITKKMEGQALRNAQYFENCYKLEEEHYKSRQNAGRKNFDFAKMTMSLNTYFLSEKFRMAGLQESYKSILGTGYSDDLLQYLVDFVEKTPDILEETCVSAYYYCYKCSRYPEEEVWFNRLYQLIQEGQLNIFTKEEQRDIILFTNNFCIRRINKGESEYLTRSFSLYQKGIETGALLEKGHLSRFTYKNIVTLGIRLQQFEWTESFIEGNQKHLEAKYRQASYSYNKATLAYALGNLEDAVGLLSKAEQDDYLIFLASKNLLLKIYYELGYFDALESLLGSLSAYIKRKQLEKIYQSNYNNIITITRKLLHLQHLTPSQRKALSSQKVKIEKLITESNPLTERKWLSEKLAQI
jgi:hypothetical protein